MTRHSDVISLVLTFLLTIAGYGLELRSNVKYLSASLVYLDKGSEAGIQIGDKVNVIRGSETIATLEVIYLSSSSSSCKIVSSTSEVRVGDEAIVEISPTIQEEKPAAPIESDVQVKSSASPNSPIVITTKPSHFIERLKGRASIQIYHQTESSGNSFTEPSLYLQTEALNIAKTGINLTIRFRTRQSQNSDGTKTWRNRLYEASLRRKVKDSKLAWGLGRLSFNRSPGIGYIDGGILEYALTPKFVFGGFLGVEPTAGGGNSQWDRLKGGGFGNYQCGDYQSRMRISTTLAITGSYQNGQPTREFLYLDNDLTLSPSLSLYQSSEIEVNRDWRKTTERSSLKLSSFMLTGRWTILKTVNLTFGYDDRTPFRDYESRSTPDSLFDDAARQGFRAGISTRLPFAGRLSIDGNSGATKGQQTSRSTTVMYNQPNIFRSGFVGSARVGIFTSAYSEGWQPSLSLSRDLTSGLGLSLHGGMNNYAFKGSNNGTSTSKWGRIGTDYSFGRRFYGSASFEYQKSDAYDSKRITIDFGARL